MVSIGDSVASVVELWADEPQRLEFVEFLIRLRLTLSLTSPFVITSNDQFRLFNTLGSDKIQLNEQSGDKFFASATTVPMEKWFCYEWHVTPNSASVYVDGKQLTDATPTGWNISNAQSLQIGYQRFQAGTSAGEIWIDDVAINTAQIGCQ